MSLEKNDLEKIEKIVGRIETNLKKEINSVRTDLTKEIGNVRTDLSKEIGSVRTEVNSVRTDLTKETGSLRADLTKEIGLSRLEANQKFEVLEEKMDANQKVVLQKIDEIRQMETEDIQVIYDDIARIKKQLPV